MDPVTHALAGTTISYAAFRERLGPKATAAAALFALAPDVDVAGFILRHYFRLGNPATLMDAFVDHRAETHAFLFQAMAAPILGWIAWRWSGRRGHWGLWMLLALLAMGSHAILDLCTHWGTRAYLPFTNERVVWRAWPLLTKGVVIPLAAAYVVGRWAWDTPDAAPEAERRRRMSAWVARAAILWSVAYLAWF